MFRSCGASERWQAMGAGPQRKVRRDTGPIMTRDEQLIYQRVSRRGFMGATAAGTLSALVGRAPTLLHQPPRKPATADAMIVLWMAGGMAQTETFDPKRYT